MAKRNIQSKNRVKVKRNTSGLIPFVKGDPRINRNGRPKNFDELRALVQEIGEEELTQDGLTRIAAKIRLMFSSKNAGDTQTLLAYGWGKPKEEIELTWREKAQELGYDPDELVHQTATAIAELGTGSNDRGGDSTETAQAV